MSLHSFLINYVNKGFDLLLSGNQDKQLFHLTENLNGNRATAQTFIERLTYEAIQLQQGDGFGLQKMSDKGEFACVDYIEFIPVEGSDPVDSPTPDDDIDAGALPAPTLDPRYPVMRELETASLKGGIPEYLSLIKIIDSGDNIQTATNDVSHQGGGVIVLKNGTYQVNSEIHFEDNDGERAGGEKLTIDHYVPAFEPVERESLTEGGSLSNNLVDGSYNIMAPNSELTLTNETQIWQSDPLLQHYSQWLLQQGLPIAVDGGVGENQQQPEQVRVGWQRDGLEAIAYGISVEHPDTIQRGLLAFQWAFDRQSPEGRFGRSSYPEVVAFLGAYARSLLLLRDADYTEEATSLAQYLPQLQATLEHPDFRTLEQRWETQENLQPLTNQLFWAALSYEVIHQVQPNLRLHEKSETWLARGLQRQTTQGVFPEKGGSDTTYQAVSLQMLSLLSIYNAEAGQIIRPYLQEGFTWLTSKILPDNTMDISENTRTGKNQERGPSGEFKQGRLADPEVFILWSHLGGGRISP